MSKRKILIAEDDPFISEIYLTDLETKGYQVEIATDGQQAIEKLNSGPYSLVLLDILMPKKDGFAVLSEINANPNIEIPVIVLSNLGRKEHISKALDMGAQDYIIKTQFTPQEVVDKIEKVLKEE
ncbi:MAG: response regulator [Candidatus Moranbacteria bacterium]|nr:response regulator [Candidatus Moranbacteria bacterium]